ncbi:MAG TPA: hypothetical protein VHG93_00535, partial [Longimicrobium sp.]|nr:hypothetical protein [Longimicrobium sp.]
HAADPYHTLAAVREAQGDAAGAVEAYRGFLERAARGDRRRIEAEQKVTQLAGGAPGAGGR